MCNKKLKDLFAVDLVRTYTSVMEVYKIRGYRRKVYDSVGNIGSERVLRTFADNLQEDFNNAVFKL